MVPADPEAIKDLPLFAGIPEKARAKVVEKVGKYIHVVEYEPGDTILEKGAYSDSAYVIISGAVEVLVERPPGDAPTPRRARAARTCPRGPARPSRPSRTGCSGAARAPRAPSSCPRLPADLLTGKRTILEPGELFGEISALSRYPVSASVRAETPVKLLRIQLRGLKTLMQTSKEFKKFLDTRYRERALRSHLKRGGPVREASTTPSSSGSRTRSSCSPSSRARSSSRKAAPPTPSSWCAAAT